MIRLIPDHGEKAFKIAKPQIINSEQGSQFTSSKYKDFLKEIASENNGRKDMYTISDMGQLASTFRQIINSLRKL